MYIPSHFSENDPERLRAVIRQFDFATMLTPLADGSTLEITHLPLLLDGDDRLLGHMARVNPHWRLFSEDRPTTVVFHGPHGYISPRWYTSDSLVPTWNYVTVHVTGRPQVITDPARCRDVMDQLVDRHEHGEDAWNSGRLPEKALEGLMRGIVVFEMHIDEIRGKFKLGQNKKSQDRESAIRHLANSQSADDRELAAWMADKD